jgi:hypothetical protein
VLWRGASDDERVGFANVGAAEAWDVDVGCTGGKGVRGRGS